MKNQLKKLLFTLSRSSRSAAQQDARICRKNKNLSWVALIIACTGLCLGFGCNNDCGDSATEPEVVSGSSWMGDLSGAIGPRLLNEIAIPGTHDSGTYGITASGGYADDENMDPVAKAITHWINKHQNRWYTHIIQPAIDAILSLDRDIVAKWARVQQTTFYEQLTDGIRFFDLRVQYDYVDDQYLIVHGLKAESLEILMESIKDFYDTPGNGYEVLLLDINHVFDVEHATFVDWLKSKLVGINGESLLVPRGSDLHLDSIWATGKRILLFYPDDATVAADPDLWYSEYADSPQINSGWPNKNTKSDLSKYWKNKLNSSSIKDYQWSGNFFVWQAIGTEQESNIVHCIDTLACKSVSSTLCDFIQKLFHFDADYPTNFLNWNSGVALSELNAWAASSTDKALITERVNIIIMDDYTNFFHSGGGYLELISEINGERSAPAERRGIVRSQSNVNVEEYTGTAKIVFRNEGTLAWDPATVHLGTSQPRDRISHLYTDDGTWLSHNRIEMQNTEPVRPGQDAVFQFTLTPDAFFETSYEVFELVDDVAESEGWFGGAQYQGSTSILVTYDVKDYQAQLKSKSPETTIPRFSSQQLEIVFTNVGNFSWEPDVLYLGSSNPHDHNTGIYSNDGNWVSFTRIRMQNTEPVQPGQDAIFRFEANPTLGIQSMEQTFELVAHQTVGKARAGWVGYEGTASIQVNVEEPSEGVELKYKSPDSTIARGQSQQLKIVFTNTGPTPLDPQYLYLATLDPGGDAYCLYSDDGNWISPDYIIPTNTSLIEPGEDATFEFTATADQSCPAETAATFELKFLVPYLWGYLFGPPGTTTINITVTD